MQSLHFYSFAMRVRPPGLPAHDECARDGVKLAARLALNVESEVLGTAVFVMDGPR